MENMNGSEEQYAQLHHGYQAVKRENLELHRKLSTYEPVVRAGDLSEDEGSAPQPTEHGASPTLEEVQGYDEEEKQSSPTLYSHKRERNVHENDVHRSDAFLTGFLNVNDLPISPSDVEHQTATKHALSELFVGGGQRYWKTVEDAANGIDGVHGAIYALSS